MDNIILVGYMACGKSSVKNALATSYKLESYDTDDVIEKMQGLKISKIFETKGEKYFRDLEKTVITGILESKNNCIIATGGGLPIANKSLLKKAKYVIYLKANKDTILKRVRKDRTRPLLVKNSDNEKKLEEKIEKMLQEREPVYEEIADIIIEVNNKSLEQIVEEIMLEREKIYENTCN